MLPTGVLRGLGGGRINKAKMKQDILEGMAGLTIRPSIVTRRQIRIVSTQKPRLGKPSHCKLCVILPFQICLNIKGLMAAPATLDTMHRHHKVFVHPKNSIVYHCPSFVRYRARSGYMPSFLAGICQITSVTRQGDKTFSLLLVFFSFFPFFLLISLSWSTFCQRKASSVSSS